MKKEYGHIIAYRRIFLGGHRALCGELLRVSYPGIGPGGKCPRCVRIARRKGMRDV